MRIVSRPLYRARQMGWALRPRVTGNERSEAREVLGERLFPLFEGMDGPDQRHCFDVYVAARAAGCEDSEVLTAALIHDCGKAPDDIDGRIRLWHRVAYVALDTLAPWLLRRLVRRPGGLRLLGRHAKRGVEMAAALDTPREVLGLMLGMEDGDIQDERVRMLRRADDAA